MPETLTVGFSTVLFTFISGTILLTIILFVLTRLFKFKKSKFTISLFVSAIYSLIGSISFGVSYFIFPNLLKGNIFYGIISNMGSMLIGVLLIKYFYKEKWSKTILVAIVWLAIVLILGLFSAWFFIKAKGL